MTNETARKRRGGKGIEPTPSELRFIYGRLDTYNNKDIVDELDERTGFKRSVGFIKRRRVEFEAAKFVLDKRSTRYRNPVFQGLQRKHWETLQEVAQQIVAYVDEIVGKTREEAQELKLETLKTVNDFNCRRLFEHLRAEFPEEFKDIVDLPEFFRCGSPGTDKVVLVAERGAFMGACDICRGWYAGDTTDG